MKNLCNIHYSIPDLKFDVFTIDINHSGTKLNSNGDFVLLSESLVNKLKKKAGFANTFKLSQQNSEKLPVSPMMMYLKRYE